jgi:acetylornithine deacetylase
MTIDPFAAEVRDGRLWGRGACDTKGSLAAFLTALHVADEEGWRFTRPVKLAAVAGEETGCDGARALVETDVELGEVIVGEPTRCEAVVAHKGCVWFGLETHGQSAHGSTPELGRSAIYLMRRVLAFVEEQWIPALADHDDPLLGRATASVGLIQGGEKVNVVPAKCRIDVDWRLLPEDDPESGLASLVTGLRAHLGDAADFVEVELAGPPQPGFGAALDGNLTTRLLGAVADVRGTATGRGVSYFTDAGIYSQAGCPCVVFGPGDIAYAHGQAERIELAEVHQAAEIALHLLAGLRAPGTAS